MAFIWGIPYLFIKIAVGELTPATLVFLRSAIGASLLLPIAVARKDLAPPPPRVEMAPRLHVRRGRRAVVPSF